jgi:hypothetical protein
MKDNGYDNFRKWLELNTDISEKSIKSYVGGMNKISIDLVDLGIIQVSLDEIKDIDKLKKIKENYFSIPKNKELDERGNRMYSAGFNHYINYIDTQGNIPVSNEGIVYIISNPAMPGLVKIGKTSNLESRMRSLYSSGVPLPFRILYAKKVKDYSFVEKKLHSGLRLVRENMNREFFRIPEEDVINLLEMVDGDDVTPRDDQFDDKEDKVAFEKTTRIGQRFNFEMIDIKPGSILEFIRDENVTCEVKSKSRVEFEGDDHSVSSAALIATNRMGFNWKTIAGPLNWKFEGEVLDERRKRYEEGD